MPVPERKSISLAQIVLAIRLGKHLFAIPIESVVEVFPALPIESLPDVPPFVRGTVFVRDQLLPVIDAAKRLGLEPHERSLEPPIVCLNANGRPVGIEVDEVLDLIELKAVRSFSTIDFPGSAGFLSGFVECEGRIIRLLDPEKLRDGGEARIHEEQNAVWNDWPVDGRKT